MLEGSSVIVVVPAFREEAHVGRVIETMPRFVDRIVVVDDGSDDRTSACVTSANDPRVELLVHPVRRGVGAALVTGYRAALGWTTRPTDALAVMAGDGQMDPDDLEAVALPIVRGDADYVKGTRFGYEGVRASMGWPRWIGGQVFSRLTSLAIGSPVSDSQCGFTALSRAGALALDLDDLWPGFGYPNDMLGQLACRGLRIAEVPVRPIYGSEVSKLRLRHLPRIGYLVGRAAVRRRRATKRPL
ncbi:MAG: glycosyltransferase family 2 protein [Deltaproteobacteria bacterium]|nr:glycosyltransferase family 2 protein [Deltaproteobacteria bacterium]